MDFGARAIHFCRVFRDLANETKYFYIEGTYISNSVLVLKYYKALFENCNNLRSTLLL